MKFNENKRWKVEIWSKYTDRNWETIMNNEQYQDFHDSITSHWPIEFILSSKKRLYINHDTISHYVVQELEDK